MSPTALAKRSTARRVDVVALYLRLSRMTNAENGQSAAIPRQEKAGRKVIASRWPGAEVRLYIDDDVSAWSGKRRPGYEQLLADIEAGEVQAVVTYDLDRLHRQPRDLERFFDACDRGHVTEMATCQGDINLGTSDGRVMARVLGAMAAKSSDDTSRRLKSMHEDRSSKGEAVIGHRAFGWADKMAHDPDEAPIVRELVGRFLAGESLTNLARELNARGVPTPRTRNHQDKVDAGTIDEKTGQPHQPRPAKRWASSTVRAVVENPRNAGLRAYKGEVVAEAAWPAIVSRADFERVLAILNDPDRRQVNPPRRAMLTGLVKCGTCGNNLTRATNGEGYGRMRCQRTPHNPDACGTVTVSLTKLEARVLDLYFRRLDRSPDLPRAIAGTADDDDTAAAELADVEDRMAQLVDMFAAGEIDRAGLLGGRKKLEARQSALRATMARQRRTTALNGFVGKPGALRAAWDDLSDDRRRAILSALIDRVTVAPATSRGSWKPERVEVSWRH